MTVGERLRAAAARVRQSWGQGQYLGEDGRVCAMGALFQTKDFFTTLDRDYWEEVEWICRAAGLSGTGTGWVVLWNDKDGQTAENVAVTLELAGLLWDEHIAQELGLGNLAALAAPLA